MTSPLHVGIVGCSAPGAALCYQTFCTEASAELGSHRHPQVTLHTTSLGEYLEALEGDGWGAVAALMIDSTRKLAAVGADFAICPDNTIHECFDEVVEQAPIPLLHIAEAVADEAERRGYRQLGITGTRYLVEGRVYPGVLERRGLGWTLPEAADRTLVDRIIFSELVAARIVEGSQRAFEEVVQRLALEGCDAVVLGCTELPLLADPDRSALPLLDSTRLLARAALRRAIAGEP